MLYSALSATLFPHCVLQALTVAALATANPLGLGCAATIAGLIAGRSALRPNDFEPAGPATWIGRIAELDGAPVMGELAAYDCRNNRLAQLGLRQDEFELAVARVRQKYGAERIATLLGTSTSGILETELAYRKRSRDGRSGDAALPAGLNYRCSHNLYSVGDFVRRYLQLDGPAVVVSTACSSSAKVFATAYRYIAAGLCDAAVVGGVDSLCLTTLYGFASLELLSGAPCRPYAENRDGISIGEAAGFILLERAEPGDGRDSGESAGKSAFTGYGESSDAYHMSSPHPEGAGARLAMQGALASAGRNADDVDYINLHGTATTANDNAEDRAVFGVFGAVVPCSSTKGATGHTLGAAGALEAIIANLCLLHDFIPGTINTAALDPAMRSDIVVRGKQQKLRSVLSNSFGFGGNNCSLLFSRLD